MMPVLPDRHWTHMKVSPHRSSLQSIDWADDCVNVWVEENVTDHEDPAWRCCMCTFFFGSSHSLGHVRGI